MVDKSKLNILNSDISPAAMKAIEGKFKSTENKITKQTTGLGDKETENIIGQNVLQGEISKTVNQIVASMTPGGNNDVTDGELDTIIALANQNEKVRVS